MHDSYDNLPRVIKVIDAYSFVVNKGEENGISPDRSYLVFGLGENLFDPQTGENLGILELVRGRAMAVHIQEKVTIFKSSETQKIPGTIKRIRRDDISYGIGALMGHAPQVEEIEEGAETVLKKMQVEVGDRLRPI